MKIQIQVMPNGEVHVMDEEFEPVSGARAEITEAAEGQIWLDVELP